MTGRTLERLAQFAAADTRFSASAAAHKLAQSTPMPDEQPSRHGVDLAELIRRLEADAQSR